MEEREIVIGNELIAQFMGLESRKPSWSMAIQFQRDNYWIPVGALQYHTSWDWLRPVIEEIFKYGLAHPEQVKKITSMSIVVDINRAWEEVVDFIQWYNTHK